MKPLRRAAARIREAGSMPLLMTFLLLALVAMSAPLAAGERSRPSDSSDTGRTAEPRSGGGSAPSYSPPPPSSTGPGPSSGSGSEPRVAVPRTGGDDSVSRQRPRSGSGRDDRYYRGGGYYGGWYGYGHHYPSWYYYGPYWGWGWGWWDDWFWYGRRPYYYPYGYHDRYYDRYGRYGDAGALDVDVSPGKTEVWIDGRYTGTADDFDGFPQYLWLDKGVYDLALFREGYKTIARQITIRPGTVMSLDDRMQPGESVRPEDLVTKTHERRDERIQYEERRREEISRRERDRMDDWRDRARRRMEERDEDDEEEMEEEAEERAEEMAENGIGRLRLDVVPGDASVYLDGRFVGTGIDLQRLRNGLRLEPGQHRIAIVRPGHRAEEQEFTVAPGEEVDLDIELEEMK